MRWYLRFKLSLRDLVEMMAERGLSMAHTTIMRWVQLCTGVCQTVESLRPSHGSIMARRRDVCEASWPMGVSLPGGGSGRSDQTVDFRLSARRDVTAAKAFFKKAIKGQGHPPQTITLDGYAASHRAVREMKADCLLRENTTLRSSKYLNNLIEQGWP